MPTIVRSGGGGMDVSDANATTSQVLFGATFYSNASDDIQTGTMSNKGAVSQTAPYFGSAGYYSSISVTTTGTATNAHVLSGKTFMNVNGEQNGTMANKGAATINVNEEGGAGYYSSVSINKSSLGNATAAQVLSNATFTNNAGTTQNGTIIDRGAFTKTVGVGTTESGSAGYYSNITVTGPTFSASTGTNAQILSGIKFYSNKGTLMNGTMINRGSVTCTSLAAGSTCAPGAGYYSCISIKAAAAPTLDGTATNATVLSGYTFYNTSTSSKMKGTYVPAASYLCVTTKSINSKWGSLNLGFQPVNYTVGWDEEEWATSGNTHYGIKYYVSGTYLYLCKEGSSAKNHTARIIAYA